MEALQEVIEIILLLISVISAVAAYFRFRGRSFGVSDMLIFVPLAVAADVVCYQLFQAMAGPHGESTAYGALGAMLGLFGLAPVAAGLNMVAAAATLLCLLRHAAVRYGALALVLVAWAAHLFLGHVDEMSAPGGAFNGDRVAGENWALESGAASRAECDRQSAAQAFREGCYAKLGR
ncbi:hypothetical protein [Zoogloea sp.]|uniref:hypothetical protein n=1 Tax=Zoogloea sp. TaxID=49181 RepID=UPI0032207431